MLNRFETFGIAFSIGAMVLALWLVRLETTATLALDEEESSVVFVEDGDNLRAAVADAVVDASNEAGVQMKLIVDDVVIGNGETVDEGDTGTVHYIGTLQNGQQFDNSYERGEPFTFTVGEGRVIPGWEEGILKMMPGGQRILVIPPELGYGRDGFGPIPPNATLVFAIELISVEM